MFNLKLLPTRQHNQDTKSLFVVVQPLFVVFDDRLFMYPLFGDHRTRKGHGSIPYEGETYLKLGPDNGCVLVCPDGSH